MATLPPLASLKKVEQVDVDIHLGARVVRCQLTGTLIRDQFAAVPVKNSAKGKYSWRGVFIDYETALTYLAELARSGGISEETYNDMRSQMSAHLDFTPVTAGVSYQLLQPFGTLTLNDWLASYPRASTLSDGSKWFGIPRVKAKLDSKPKRYNGFVGVASKGAISTANQPVAFTTNNVASLVTPWGGADEENEKRSYSFLLSMDGHKPPQKIVVQEMPTPQAQAKLIGLPSASDGTKVYVLETTATAKPSKKAATKSAAEALENKPESIVAESTRGKKRKTATVTATA